MKLWDALDKIEGTERKSWRVHFEHIRSGALEGDYFPEYDEIGFPGDEIAWLIAQKFAEATVGKCANIYVCEDGSNGCVSRRLNPSRSYQDASESEANDAGKQADTKSNIAAEGLAGCFVDVFKEGVRHGKFQAFPPGMKLVQPVTYREVLPVGTRVTIDDGIDARITGILIDQDGVQYKCVWWNGRERKCEWLMEFEVQAESVGKMRVGFATMQSCKPEGFGAEKLP